MPFRVWPRRWKSLTSANFHFEASLAAPLPGGDAAVVALDIWAAAPDAGLLLGDPLRRGRSPTTHRLDLVHPVGRRRTVRLREGGVSIPDGSSDSCLDFGFGSPSGGGSVAAGVLPFRRIPRRPARLGEGEDSRKGLTPLESPLCESAFFEFDLQRVGHVIESDRHSIGISQLLGGLGRAGDELQVAVPKAVLSHLGSGGQITLGSSTSPASRW